MSFELTGTYSQEVALLFFSFFFSCLIFSRILILKFRFFLFASQVASNPAENESRAEAAAEPISDAFAKAANQRAVRHSERNFRSSKSQKLQIVTFSL